MSGTGGRGGGGPVQPDPVDCDDLVFSTTLNSPKVSVISKLKAKDVLRLTLAGPRGPVVAVTSEGETAGSITEPRLVDLIRCMSEGHKYIALVLSIDAGACRVQVRPEAGS